jgi:ribonucleoside-diphosphate reductase beta chain
MLLDPGLELTLRPMKYPLFYEMYRKAIKNTWTVEEVDFAGDVEDLRSRLTDPERHLIRRLVAFFATGDTLVAHNVALNLYRHVNAPEARLFLSRQIFEEALHVQFYLTLLDAYVPHPEERRAAFAAVETIPSIRRKAEFCRRWMDSIYEIEVLRTREERRKFLLNLLTFAGAVEGLFFFAAFAYVWFLRSRGLLHGLAAGTNWVFRDESLHVDFAFAAAETARREEPELFDAAMGAEVVRMFEEAVACETQFARDLLGGGVAGLSEGDMRRYLEYVADRRLVQCGLAPRYGSRNPFPFVELQDAPEVTNFFERRVSAYQVGVAGSVSLDESF